MAAVANCDKESEEENTPKLGQHMFSEVWDESDVTLVVEGERFHVHRVLLSMHSPVFRAMFNSDFKEKDAVEITLHGKKAKEVLDLLNQVYPQEPEYLTMENVEHVLKLADEYQMKRIIQTCGKLLKAEPKIRANATMGILLLAQKYGLSEVCDDCHGPLGQLSLKELQGLEGFKMLDGENTRKLLVPHLDRVDQVIQEAKQKAEQDVAASMQKVREANEKAAEAERRAREAEFSKAVIVRENKTLELLVREVYPQYKGMMECAFYFAVRGEKQCAIPTCTRHHSVPLKETIHCKYYTQQCNECRDMICQIVRTAYKTSPSLNSKKNPVDLLDRLSNI